MECTCAQFNLVIKICEFVELKIVESCFNILVFTENVCILLILCCRVDHA